MIILKQVPDKKDPIAAYLYCPKGKTDVVKQDPQTGKLYEKQGRGRGTLWTRGGNPVGSSV